MGVGEHYLIRVLCFNIALVGHKKYDVKTGMNSAVSAWEVFLSF